VQLRAAPGAAGWSAQGRPVSDRAGGIGEPLRRITVSAQAGGAAAAGERRGVAARANGRCPVRLCGVFQTAIAPSPAAKPERIQGHKHGRGAALGLLELTLHRRLLYR